MNLLNQTHDPIMARKANSSVFLEEWLRVGSGSSISGGLVKQNSAPSARSIIQTWSEIRESLQIQKFDTRYLQALRALVSSESTIHVADPQAKLLISILALRDVYLPSESYTLALRLLYVWIRKSFRPSQALVGSAVQAIRGVVDDRRNIQPALVAQSVLVSGAFACVPSLSGEVKLLSLELLCRLLEEEWSLVGSQEELVPVVLAGIGYALSSSLDAHYVRLLDFLFGIWLKEEGPCGSVTHGLMILHLIEWVVSGYMRSNYVGKMSLFANEVLETSKAKYAVYAVSMAAAGLLRASAAGFSSGAQNFEIVSKLRNSAEKRLVSVAQLLVSNGNVLVPTTQREGLLLKCFAIALARCGSVSPSAPLLLCLASALLTQVFPLGQIYESFCKASGKGPIGPRLIWVREHLSDVIFKESGAMTGAFCNQYASASEGNRYIVENMIWDFCQNLYLQHRQIALVLRGVEDTLLGDIEKVAESSFLMVVVFALAVTKQWLSPIVSEERKMETSVKILVSFSCVEYFRHIRLPEYMETVREVISRVQENDATCVSFVESIPAYDSLTNPKDLFTQRIEYEWSRDDVQTSRILFYLRVIPTCIGRLSASAFRRVVASTIYIGHPNRKVARASHTLLVAFFSSAKDSEEDERNQLKEQLVFYYMQRSLEVYPEITPFEGLASGVAALIRHLPAGSPAIFYSVHSLVEKASTFNTDALQGRKSDPGNQILELLLRLVSLVDIQVLPYLMKSLAQLIIKLPKERQDMVLGELYGQVAESDDVIRKPSLVSWLQSLNYLCSNSRTKGSASGTTIDTSNQLAARLYHKTESFGEGEGHYVTVTHYPQFLIHPLCCCLTQSQGSRDHPEHHPDCVRARNAQEDLDPSERAAVIAVSLIICARGILKLDSVGTQYAAQYLVDCAGPKKEREAAAPRHSTLTMRDCLEYLVEVNTPKTESEQREFEERRRMLTVKDCLECAFRDGMPLSRHWTHLGCVHKPPPFAHLIPRVPMKGQVVEVKTLDEAFKLLRQQPVGAKLHKFEGVPVAEVQICYKKDTFSVKVSAVRMLTSLGGDDSQLTEPTGLLVDFIIPRFSS
ncbi:unnamed protein product [Thlaspi arvense]|uniref:Uncharacterized protein n=1 Tax=Thlaspi arvense TaxID=13288 RepID=A0AAU9SG14_THLAR|nr:unnamed protein product [Thlaspi arvense]